MSGSLYLQCKCGNKEGVPFDIGDSCPLCGLALKEISIYPRLLWCFECQRKLRNIKHTTLRSLLDGHDRIFHKKCAEDLLKQVYSKWEKI